MALGHGEGTENQPNATTAKRMAIADAVRWCVILASLLAWLRLFISKDLNRYLWLDEILTLMVARQPDFKSIWHALEIGPQAADSPFYAYLGHLLIHWVGREELALRLPSSLGVVIAFLALYLVAARRGSPCAAAVALIFPMTSVAVRYGFEGRAYGLWLAFTALGVLCWQQAGLGRHRAISLVGLALCLAGGVLSHYYSVFVTAVFAGAELVRTWERRKVDPGVWAALLFSGLPILACWPLIKIASAYPKDSWATPYWSQPLFIYQGILGISGTAVLAFLLVWNATLVLQRRQRGFAIDPKLARTPIAGPDCSEISLAMGLALLPVILVVVAKLVTNNLHLRYTLPCVCGMALLLSFLVDTIGRDNRVAKGAFVVALALMACYSFRSMKAFEAGLSPPFTDFELQLRSRPDKTIPVALLMTENATHFDGYFYHPNRDVHFVLMQKNDNLRLLFKLLKPFTDAKFVEPGELADLGKFYVVPGTPTPSDRLFEYLKKAGAHFSEPTLMDNGETLYLVEINKSASAGPVSR